MGEGFSNSQNEKACYLNELGACCAPKARDAPQGEVLLNAHGIHDPVALLASGQCQGRGEVGINGKHAQVRLGRVDGCQGGRRHQCDGHREVGHEVASMLVQFANVRKLSLQSLVVFNAFSNLAEIWTVTETTKLSRASQPRAPRMSHGVRRKYDRYEARPR